MVEAVLVDVDDQVRAFALAGKDVLPGGGGHVGDDDEGLLGGDCFDGCREIMSF